MKAFLQTSLLVLLAVLLLQSPASAISEGAAIFLMIRPGARASGMGSAFTAIADDATATYFNPAGLAFLNRREFTLMHSPWFSELWKDVGDMYYEFVGYVQPVKGWGGNVGANLIFLSEGENPWVNADGVQLGTFSSYEFSPSISYGAALRKNLGVGITTKIIHSHLAPFGGDQFVRGKGQATTWAIDLGVLYKSPFKGILGGFAAGACVQNIGPKLAYVDVENADPLNTNLRAGLSYRFFNNRLHRLTGDYEISKTLIALNDSWRRELNEAVLHAGLEYVYYDLLALRTGYVEDDVGRIMGPTFGGGLSYKMLSFDFAMEPGGELQKYNRKFSLTAKF